MSMESTETLAHEYSAGSACSSLYVLYIYIYARGFDLRRVVQSIALELLSARASARVRALLYRYVCTYARSPVTVEFRVLCVPLLPRPPPALAVALLLPILQTLFYYFFFFFFFFLLRENPRDTRCWILLLPDCLQCVTWSDRARARDVLRKKRMCVVVLYSGREEKNVA